MRRISMQMRRLDANILPTTFLLGRCRNTEILCSRRCKRESESSAAFAVTGLEVEREALGRPAHRIDP